MKLSIGIVGLPNVGKSTLFETLTQKQVDKANYPFCTIDPNIGVVAVPDERVDLLANLTHSQKKIYATIDFIDIAGLVKGASQGEGLGNKFLANIRETDAILYVLRAFSNNKIINTHDLPSFLCRKLHCKVHKLTARIIKKNNGVIGLTCLLRIAACKSSFSFFQ